MLITFTSIFYPSGRFKVGQNVRWFRSTNFKNPPSAVKDIIKITFTYYGNDWTQGVYSMKQDYFSLVVTP